MPDFAQMPFSALPAAAPDSGVEAEDSRSQDNTRPYESAADAAPSGEPAFRQKPPPGPSGYFRKLFQTSPAHIRLQFAQAVPEHQGHIAASSEQKYAKERLPVPCILSHGFQRMSRLEHPWSEHRYILRVRHAGNGPCTEVQPVHPCRLPPITLR